MSWDNNDNYAVEGLPDDVSIALPKKRGTERAAERAALIKKDMKHMNAINEIRDGNPVTDERVIKILGAGHTAKEHTLTMIKKDIVDIKDIPKLASKINMIEILILRDNEITELNTSFLPPNLKILDLRNNKITKVLGEFPSSIQYIWLDNNKLQTLPKFPSDAISVVTSGNPIHARNAFESEIKDIKDRTQIWMTSEVDQFSPSSSIGSEIIYRFYPVNVFDGIKQDAKDFIDDSICRGIISTAYLLNKLQIAHHLIVEVYDGKPIGMCIFNIKSNEIYISLLCSHKDNKGGGSRILKTIQDYFYDNQSLNRITLESVSDARGFYEKLGFKPCIEGQLCPMQYTRVADHMRSKSKSKSKSESNHHAGGGTSKRSHFKFHSEQVHSVIKNGHHMVRRNAVTVKNGRGEKTKEILDSKRGKTAKRKSKPLTKREIANIQKGIFMPRLFKEFN